ncbi:hypothetical protein [Gordonia rhizosphera]|uniref:Uncharacterized protein n=1 Tax=Gordonia rhizosphera NBRC 16068 TaxID=1108045 RepID=K6VVA7_9ACTN|nr:hypothetical protein [Gordonia rhizosphera]GAB90790.1 hypothetical protein GORHZ_118_00060 [Gordonia rhizosphera NBRC 16068]
MMQDQVVDTPAATEFFERVLQLCSTDELAAIGADLQRKSAAMRSLAGDDPATVMDVDSLRELLGWVFCARRKTNKIFALVDPADLATGIADLLHGTGGIVTRYDRFTALLEPLPEIAEDLPGELLHFLDPARYWLWTRWMWDPTAETGALALVTTDDTDLGTWGSSRGEVYLNVGRAVAFVEETGKAAGFTDLGSGLFGTDVFLAAVYGIYLNTVLSMRTTRELTQMLPALPELTRRLLGVHYAPHRKA